MRRWWDKSERIRIQAASWFAKLQGEPEPDDQIRFQQWLSSDPRHRQAYDRIAGQYSRVADLRGSKFARERSLESVDREQHRPFPYALVTGAAILLLGIGSVPFLSGIPFHSPLASQAVLLSTGPEGRGFELRDGSKVRLDKASELKVDLEQDERRVELLKGRATITVASDERPFVIIAGSERRRTAGGRIEAQVDNGKGSIILSDAGGTISSVAPWQLQGPQHSGLPEVTKPEILEFAGTSLAEAAAQANRAAGRNVILVDPRASSLRVTGVYRSDDPVGLAQSLAAAFSLEIVKRAPDQLLLVPGKK